MQGDPIDPVTFKRAAKELFERLAAYEGIDLAKFNAGYDPASPDVLAERDKTDERLGELRGEAEFRLQGLMIVEEVRTWTSSNGDWRRVTQEQLQAWLMSAADEHPVFYVDREELKYLRPDRYTLTKHAGQVSSEPSDVGRGKPGRPLRSGTFAATDEALLDEMQALLESGEARSLHHASILIADKAEGGGQPDSKARRLRDRFRQTRTHGE